MADFARIIAARKQLEAMKAGLPTHLWNGSFSQAMNDVPTTTATRGGRQGDGGRRDE